MNVVELFLLQIALQKGHQINQAPGSYGWRNVLQDPVTAALCNSRRQKTKFDTEK